MTTKSFAVVLSGCGVFDGAEIHESVMTLLALDQQSCKYVIFAPDIEQMHVVNHITGKPENEKRNVLTESARIARGSIKPLSEYSADNFDGIIFPGGFGAAKNLSTYAIDGANCSVNSDVERAVLETRKKGKVIGAMCISPVIIAKILGKVQVTIGTDADTAKNIESMGALHQKCERGEVAIDKHNKIATTPCYMVESSIKHIYDGACNLVKALLEL